jgi:heme a synthase
VRTKAHSLKFDGIFNTQSLFLKNSRNFWTTTKKQLNIEIPEHLKTQKEFKLDAYKDFTSPTEELVMKGKEKLVGSWLLLTTGAVFFMIVVGGYTRLSKSGLSMTKWKPQGYKYPSSPEEWNDEFENYKVFNKIDATGIYFRREAKEFTYPHF